MVLDPADGMHVDLDRVGLELGQNVPSGMPGAVSVS